MNTEFWGGAALIGILAGFWGQVRNILHNIFSLFIVTITIRESSGTIGTVVMHQLWNNGKPLFRGDIDYYGYYMKLKSSIMKKFIPCERIGTPRLFWYGKVPILAGLVRSDRGDNYEKLIQIMFIRWTIDPDKFILNAASIASEHGVKRKFTITKLCGNNGRLSAACLEKGGQIATQEYNEDMHLYGYRLIGHSLGEIGYEQSANNYNILALSDAVTDLITDIKRWYESQQWYEEKCIPWKYGALLYGPPGNGKTQTVYCLANDLNLPVYSFDLSSMCNEEFLTHWKEFLTKSPAIALFEDIDAVFKGRENISGEEGVLSFDCFINAIGGIELAAGVLVIITTNNPETIDPAIYKFDGGEITSRPGRVDRAVCFNPPDKEGKFKIASRILNDCENKIKEVLEAGVNDSGAQFQERCRRIALENFWKGRNVGQD